MQYHNSHLARFIDRPNRFIAYCRLIATGEIVTVHVKNTGRTTILQPNVTVSLVKSDNPARKTRYDLVAAKKYDQFWINIDSQAPNKIIKVGLQTNYIQLPGIRQITEVTPEVPFLDSRLDFAGIGDHEKQFFLEVKGVTLENRGIAAFPDAPTTRGLKHVKTLQKALDKGALSYLLFTIQMENITAMTIDTDIFEPLAIEIAKAQRRGVHVLAYDCHVTADTLTLNRPIPFDLKQPFISDGLPSSIKKRI